MKTEIEEYDEGWPELYVEVGGYGYSFSIRCVEKDSREFIQKMVSRNMKEVYERARQEKELEMQKSFKELLGIKESK